MLYPAPRSLWARECTKEPSGNPALLTLPHSMAVPRYSLHGGDMSMSGMKEDGGWRGAAAAPTYDPRLCPREPPVASRNAVVICFLGGQGEECRLQSEGGGTVLQSEGGGSQRLGLSTVTVPTVLIPAWVQGVLWCPGSRFATQCSAWHLAGVPGLNYAGMGVCTPPARLSS